MPFDPSHQICWHPSKLTNTKPQDIEPKDMYANIESQDMYANTTKFLAFKLIT